MAVMSTDCGTCTRSFATSRGRSLHMAQVHPVEWAAEGEADGKAAERAYFRERKRINSAKDPERYRGYTRRWRAEHPERVAATLNDWRDANADHVREYQESWRATNREHMLEYAIVRRLTGRASRPSVLALARARRKAWARDLMVGAVKARREVAKAIRSGDLVKEPCAVCRGPKVEGHHYLGYAPEHRLHVRWLCKEHHTEAHRPDGVARRRRVEARLAEAAA